MQQQRIQQRTPKLGVEYTACKINLLFSGLTKVESGSSEEEDARGLEVT